MTAWQTPTIAEESGIGRLDPVSSALVSPIRLTLFRDTFARRKREREVSLLTMAEAIGRWRAGSKDELWLLKLATFDKLPSAKGCLRYDANLLEITGVEGDFDTDEKKLSAAEIAYCAKYYSFRGAVAAMRAVGILSLLYTSPSHTPDCPRWRVLCPTSRAYPAKERARFMNRLAVILARNDPITEKRVTILAGESFKLSQAYYFGHVDGRSPIEIELVEGRYIDNADELDAFIPDNGARIASPSEAGGGDWLTLVRVRSAMSSLSAEIGYPTWVRYGQALKNDFGEAGWPIWRDWSATGGEKYDGEASCRRVWNTIRPPGPRPIGIATIFKDAIEAGWEGIEDDIVVDGTEDDFR